MKVSGIAWIVIAVVTLSAAGNSLAQPEQQASPTVQASSNNGATRAENRALRKRVKVALKNTKGLTAVAITVKAKGGKITLQGTVPTQDEVDLAANAARQVPGVVSVDNLLTVNRPTNSWR